MLNYRRLSDDGLQNICSFIIRRSFCFYLLRIYARFGFGKDKFIMKYVVILGDGMADYPVKELGDRTPLTAAEKPCIDGLAKYSEIGLVKTVQTI